MTNIGRNRSSIYFRNEIRDHTLDGKCTHFPQITNLSRNNHVEHSLFSSSQRQPIIWSFSRISHFRQTIIFRKYVRHSLLWQGFLLLWQDLFGWTRSSNFCHHLILFTAALVCWCKTTVSYKCFRRVALNIIQFWYAFWKISKFSRPMMWESALHQVLVRAINFQSHLASWQITDYDSEVSQQFGKSFY